MCIRDRGTSGLAMSIGFNGKDVEGQTWGQIVEGMRWDTAAQIAAQIVDGMIHSLAATPSIINCNVPNKPLDELDGWSVADVGGEPPRKLTTGKLVPGDPDEHGEKFHLSMDWGRAGTVKPGTDSYLVRNNQVSVTWLGKLTETTPDAAQHDAVSSRLNTIL